MTVKLITDDLSTDNRTFRLQIIDNFKQLETAANDVDDRLTYIDTLLANIVTKKDMTDSETTTANGVKSQLNALSARINRIVMGTDDESIRLVLNDLLQEEGVIK